MRACPSTGNPPSGNCERSTADYRLLFGGGVVYSGTAPADIIRRLKPHIDKTFPYLKDKKIDFAWSGNFAGRRHA